MAAFRVKPQAAHQHPGILFILQGLTSQLRQNYLGHVGRGVHQHPTINGYKKIRLAPLPKIEKSLIGIDTVNYPPRPGHLKSSFDLGQFNLHTMGYNTRDLIILYQFARYFKAEKKMSKTLIEPKNAQLGVNCYNE